MVRTFCFLITHFFFVWQTGCSPDITSFPHQETSSKVEKTSVNSALRNGYSASGRSGGGASARGSAAIATYTLDDSDDEVTILNSDEVEVELPCEFCNEAYPASVLNKHQVICGMNLGTASAGLSPT